MITVVNNKPEQQRCISLWEIPIGTTFTGLIMDRTNGTPGPFGIRRAQAFRGLFLRGTGWVCQLNPEQNRVSNQSHVGWSLSERDHNGTKHRDIRVLSYRPVNVAIAVG